MDKYTILFQQNPGPLDIPQFCQNGFFFNEIDHLHQQNNGQFHLLTALNLSTQQAEARCAFFVRSGEAVSPVAAPFGSIEFTESLPEIVLNELLSALSKAARSVEATSLRIVNYPHCYAPEQAQRLTSQLINHGFCLAESNLNFFLPITSQPFDHRIASAEHRRLRKCQDAGFEFIHWKTPDIERVIAFLQETRRQKGYSLTIQPETLASLLSDFPDQFAVFAVTNGDELIALLVAVRVRQDILYSFLPASHPDYHTFSPMVMLMDGLFTYCQQQKIRLLDLGVSLDANRQPKPSLMRFKRNLGAQESPKLVFEKAL